MMTTILYRRLRAVFLNFTILSILTGFLNLEAANNSGLRVLFLGDNGHHRPADRFKQLQLILAKNGIEIEYTDKLDDLNPAKLAGYDVLAIYANWTQISPLQEKAMLEFVQNGGGLAPIHCASACFGNSAKYIETVGAQFQRHGAGVFKDTIVKPDHPVMKGLSAIESWDESYVHTKHNQNRTVLSERRDDSGSEPWTWVREEGRGRVFYTAWGHDQRTWSNPGFLALVENGIRWAGENSPMHLKPRSGLKPLEQMEAPDKLPNYTPNAQWGTQGEPITKMQKPLSPEESMKHLVTVPGFDVSLFASEPEIVKPLWLSWDERGRLWIAESVDYPNELKPIGEGRDRLKICEDTNGDGKADKFTVFADKLSIPTGFVFANGGVIVIHSGKTEFFKDTNGDDKADETKELFTGWNMGDTHATASNLRHGFDGWIWGVVGYSGFRGTVGGKEVRFGQGIFRFKPDGSALEFIRSSNNNTWGLAITEDNIIIGSTANGNASMYMPIPNRYYEAVRGWSASRIESIATSQRFFPITDQVRQVDFHGRYTAGSGSGLYTARAFPKEYWNRVQFVAEPTGHLLGQFYLERKGADFIAHNARNFAASDDEWTSPIYAEVGPDSALWIVDWYNYIIQHNPTPRGFQTGKGAAYETPLRDKNHGRIYRVTHKSAPAMGTADQAMVDSLSRGKNSPNLWVNALKNNNMLWRMHAQRLLVERGNKDVIPALCALVRDNKIDEIGLNTAAIHALWTLHGLGALESGEGREVTVAALKHPSAGVRRAAIMTLPRDEAAKKALLSSNVVEDSDGQVRMAALLALSEMPSSDQSARTILASLQDPRNAEDRWIPDAATSAAAKNDAPFIKAVLESVKPAGVSASTQQATTNFVQNSSFEQVSGNRPDHWRTTTHSGRGEFAIGEFGRTGGKSAKITSETGGDISWATTVAVNPRTDYKLTGWIKTEKVEKIGRAQGAMFNIHELQDPVRGGTKALTGDNDWTQVELTFNSGELRQITINCLFGGWGRARGTAWFDDVQLVPVAGSELGGQVGRVVRLVTTHYAQRGPVDSIVPTLAAMKGASPQLSVAVLDGLMSGWPSDNSPNLSDSDKKLLAELMESLPETSRDRLLALAQKWNQPNLFGSSVAAIIDTLKQQIADGSLADDKRASAARRLVGLEDNASTIELVLKQINALSPPAFASGLVSALSDSRNPATGRGIIDAWGQLSPAVRRNAIAVLMRRGEWAMVLLEAVDKKQVNKGDLAADHWSQLKQNPNRAVARRAERLAEIATPISADREEVIKKLLPLARERGDAVKGKEVFTAQCANCHMIGGQGGKIGPDLTGIGARDRAEVLTEILDPNRSVEANYGMWNVNTKDGETYSGRMEAETQTTVEILDTTGQKHVIQRKDIESLQASALSIMPNGLEALPADDIKNLLEYLAQSH